ncbi:hypothetical protein ACFP65_08625 [Marinilactibacillus sp. GCM10026970]|uniref:hypothetical protein n=1 Tax=Marinilactibacillus sp. GCM10026970 TaxID=3252642 RepID=UPI00361B163D
MLNQANDTIYKKCLFPLFGALMGSIWKYVWGLNDTVLDLILGIIVIGLFIFALINIKKMIDRQLFMKLISYTLVFVVVFQIAIYAISIVFQGMIAFIMAIILLKGFWEIVTS